jgi:hypothetical protein
MVAQAILAYGNLWLTCSNWCLTSYEKSDSGKCFINECNCFRYDWWFKCVKCRPISWNKNILHYDFHGTAFTLPMHGSFYPLPSLTEESFHMIFPHMHTVVWIDQLTDSTDSLSLISVQSGERQTVRKTKSESINQRYSFVLTEKWPWGKKMHAKTSLVPLQCRQNSSWCPQAQNKSPQWWRCWTKTELQ